jgi:hypothetical protein
MEKRQDLGGRNLTLVELVWHSHNEPHFASRRKDGDLGQEHAALGNNDLGRIE